MKLSKRQVRELRILMALPVKERAERMGLKVEEIVTPFGTILIWKG